MTLQWWHMILPFLVCCERSDSFPFSSSYFLASTSPPPPRSHHLLTCVWVFLYCLLAKSAPLAYSIGSNNSKLKIKSCKINFEQIVNVTYLILPFFSKWFSREYDFQKIMELDHDIAFILKNQENSVLESVVDVYCKTLLHKNQINAFCLT